MTLESHIDVAAEIAVLGGYDMALTFLRTKDPFERSLLEQLHKRMTKKKEILDHNLATEIVNAISKAFKK